MVRTSVALPALGLNPRQWKLEYAVSSARASKSASADVFADNVRHRRRQLNGRFSLKEIMIAFFFKYVIIIEIVYT